MSSAIFNNNKVILKVSWGVLDTLCNEFSNILKTKNLPNNSPSVKFISYMELINENPCNGCLDISDFFTTTKDLLCFIKIVEEAILNITPGLKNATLTILSDFYTKLIIL